MPQIAKETTRSDDGSQAGAPNNSCIAYTMRRINARATISGMAIGRKNGGYQRRKTAAATSISASVASGSSIRLTLPRPRRTTSASDADWRRSRRSSIQPIAKQTAMMASSHQPAGEASAASMWVKSIGTNTRKVYRNWCSSDVAAQRVGDTRYAARVSTTA